MDDRELENMSDIELREFYFRNLREGAQNNVHLTYKQVNKCLNAIERLRRKETKFYKKVCGIMLMNDFEKAKADGIRAQLKIFFDYIRYDSSIGELSMKSICDVIKEGYDNLDDERCSLLLKVLYTICGLPLGIVIMSGAMVAISGIKAIDFLKKLKQSPKVIEELERNGKLEELNKAIENYEKGSDMYNPYQVSAGEYNLGLFLDDNKTLFDNSTYEAWQNVEREYKTKK